VASFFDEVRRRKVLRVAGLYLVGAWAALQIADVVVPALFLPGWTVSLVLYVLILAFPLVLVLAWHFDLTPDGLKKDVDGGGRGVGGLKAGLAFSVVFAIVGAASLYLYGHLSDRATEQQDLDEVPVASVAVLPFDNVSADADQQYFSDGITEELINVLARVPGLRVTAQASSFQFSSDMVNVDYADIAGQLGVAALVTGSVRRSENSVRVTARLVNAESGHQVWSENYDRQLTDIFAIQDEIASAIGESLRVKLIQEGTIKPSVTRTASIDAYNLYLLGRFHFNKRSVFELEQAMSYFEEAIERDPAYAPAYNGLVDSILLASDEAYGSVPLEQSIARALPLIERSLELDPLLAETHASLGLLRMLEWDSLASEAALKRAIELSPNLSKAHLWLYVTYDRAAQHRNAFETLQRAFALDPLSPIVNTNLAAEYWIRNRTDDALQAAGRIIQLAPNGPLGYRRTARIKWTSGRLAEAVDYYRRSLVVAPEDRNSRLELGSLMVDIGYYDDAMELLDNQQYVALMAAGRIDEALAAIRLILKERPNHSRTIFAAAKVEARAGNYQAARELLEPLAEGAGTGKGTLFTRSGIHFWDPQIAAIDLATALLETGETEAGHALLVQIESYYERLRTEGLDHPMLDYQKARVLSLQGNPDEAIRVLRRVIAGGWRFWHLDGDPALNNLHNMREFQSIVGDRNRLVDEERALIEAS